VSWTDSPLTSWGYSQSGGSPPIIMSGRKGVVEMSPGRLHNKHAARFHAPRVMPHVGAMEPGADR
jgi:hypothetical protein